MEARGVVHCDGLRLLIQALYSMRRHTALVLAAQFVTAFNYFLSMAVFVQYLSYNLHLDDVQASVVYSGFGVLISVFGIVAGPIVDEIGTFTGLLWAGGLSLVARLAYAFTPLVLDRSASTLAAAILAATILPLSESLLSQVCAIGIKRYSQVGYDAEEENDDDDDDEYDHDNDVNTVMETGRRQLHDGSQSYDSSASRAGIDTIKDVPLTRRRGARIGSSKRPPARETRPAPSIAPIPPPPNSLPALKGRPASSIMTDGLEYSLSYVIQNVAAVLAYATLAILGTLTADEHRTNTFALYATLPAFLALFIISIYGQYTDWYDIDMASSRRERDHIGSRLDQGIDYAGPCCCCCCAKPRLKYISSGKTPVLHRWWRYLVWCCCSTCVNTSLLRGSMGRRLARFMGISVLAIGAKTVFRHMEATMPKYTQRMFDPRYPYSTLLLINPTIVVSLTLFLNASLLRFDTLATIIVGTAICASATLIAMIPHPAALITFLVLFSIGEIIWSPRLTAYVLKTAPRGHEGTFSSIAGIPLFAAKLPVGLMSGLLLDRFCPSAAACQSEALWGIIAAVAAISPLGLTLLYPWLRERRSSSTRHIN